MPEGKFSSRKLMVITVAFVVGIALSCFGKLDDVTANFIVYMCGAYLAGNVSSKIADVFNTKKG
jgi:hypothetical protein